MGFPHNDVVTAVVPRHSDLKSKTPFGNYMAETKPVLLELVSKELNHLAAILHVYARCLNFMK